MGSPHFSLRRNGSCFRSTWIRTIFLLSIGVAVSTSSFIVGLSGDCPVMKFSCNPNQNPGPYNHTVTLDFGNKASARYFRILTDAMSKTAFRTSCGQVTVTQRSWSVFRMELVFPDQNCATAEVVLCGLPLRVKLEADQLSASYSGVQTSVSTSVVETCSGGVTLDTNFRSHTPAVLDVTHDIPYRAYHVNVAMVIGASLPYGVPMDVVSAGFLNSRIRLCVTIGDVFSNFPTFVPELSPDLSYGYSTTFVDTYTVRSCLYLDHGPNPGALAAEHIMRFQDIYFVNYQSRPTPYTRITTTAHHCDSDFTGCLLYASREFIPSIKINPTTMFSVYSESTLADSLQKYLYLGRIIIVAALHNTPGTLIEITLPKEIKLYRPSVSAVQIASATSGTPLIPIPANTLKFNIDPNVPIEYLTTGTGASTKYIIRMKTIDTPATVSNPASAIVRFQITNVYIDEPISSGQVTFRKYDMTGQNAYALTALMLQQSDQVADPVGLGTFPSLLALPFRAYDHSFTLSVDMTNHFPAPGTFIFVVYREDNPATTSMLWTYKGCDEIDTTLMGPSAANTFRIKINGLPGSNSEFTNRLVKLNFTGEVVASLSASTPSTWSIRFLTETDVVIMGITERSYITNIISPSVGTAALSIHPVADLYYERMGTLQVRLVVDNIRLKRNDEIIFSLFRPNEATGKQLPQQGPLLLSQNQDVDAQLESCAASQLSIYCRLKADYPPSGTPVPAGGIMLNFQLEMLVPSWTDMVPPSVEIRSQNILLSRGNTSRNLYPSSIHRVKLVISWADGLASRVVEASPFLPFYHPLSHPTDQPTTLPPSSIIHTHYAEYQGCLHADPRADWKLYTDQDDHFLHGLRHQCPSNDGLNCSWVERNQHLRYNPLSAEFRSGTSGTRTGYEFPNTLTILPMYKVKCAAQPAGLSGTSGPRLFFLYHAPCPPQLGEKTALLDDCRREVIQPTSAPHCKLTPRSFTSKLCTSRPVQFLESYLNIIHRDAGLTPAPRADAPLLKCPTNINTSQPTAVTDQSSAIFTSAPYANGDQCQAISFNDCYAPDDNTNMQSATIASDSSANPSELHTRMRLRSSNYGEEAGGMGIRLWNLDDGTDNPNILPPSYTITMEFPKGGPRLVLPSFNSELGPLASLQPTPGTPIQSMANATVTQGTRQLHIWVSSMGSFCNQFTNCLECHRHAATVGCLWDTLDPTPSCQYVPTKVDVPSNVLDCGCSSETTMIGCLAKGCGWCLATSTNLTAEECVSVTPRGRSFIPSTSGETCLASLRFAHYHSTNLLILEPTNLSPLFTSWLRVSTHLHLMEDRSGPDLLVSTLLLDNYSSLSLTYDFSSGWTEACKAGCLNGIGGTWSVIDHDESPIGPIRVMPPSTLAPGMEIDDVLSMSRFNMTEKNRYLGHQYILTSNYFLHDAFLRTYSFHVYIRFGVNERYPLGVILNHNGPMLRSSRGGNTWSHYTLEWGIQKDPKCHPTSHKTPSTEHEYGSLRLVRHIFGGSLLDPMSQSKVIWVETGQFPVDTEVRLSVLVHEDSDAINFAVMVQRSDNSYDHTNSQLLRFITKDPSRDRLIGGTVGLLSMGGIQSYFERSRLTIFRHNIHVNASLGGFTDLLRPGLYNMKLLAHDSTSIPVLLAIIALSSSHDNAPVYSAPQLRLEGYASGCEVHFAQWNKNDSNPRIDGPHQPHFPPEIITLDSTLQLAPGDIVALGFTGGSCSGFSFATQGYPARIPFSTADDLIWACRSLDTSIEDPMTVLSSTVDPKNLGSRIISGKQCPQCFVPQTPVFTDDGETFNSTRTGAIRISSVGEHVCFATIPSAGNHFRLKVGGVTETISQLDKGSAWLPSLGGGLTNRLLPHDLPSMGVPLASFNKPIGVPNRVNYPAVYLGHHDLWVGDMDFEVSLEDMYMLPGASSRLFVMALFESDIIPLSYYNASTTNVRGFNRAGVALLKFTFDLDEIPFTRTVQITTETFALNHEVICFVTSTLSFALHSQSPNSRRFCSRNHNVISVRFSHSEPLIGSGQDVYIALYLLPNPENPSVPFSSTHTDNFFSISVINDPPLSIAPKWPQQFPRSGAYYNLFVTIYNVKITDNLLFVYNAKTPLSLQTVDSSRISPTIWSIQLPTGLGRGYDLRAALIDSNSQLLSDYNVVGDYSFPTWSPPSIMSSNRYRLRRYTGHRYGTREPDQIIGFELRGSGDKTSQVASMTLDIQFYNSSGMAHRAMTDLPRLTATETSFTFSTPSIGWGTATVVLKVFNPHGYDNVYSGSVEFITAGTYLPLPEPVPLNGLPTQESSVIDVHRIDGADFPLPSLESFAHVLTILLNDVPCTGSNQIFPNSPLNYYCVEVIDTNWFHPYARRPIYADLGPYVNEQDCEALALYMGYVQFGAGQGSSTDRALRCYGGDDFETYYSNFIVITNAPNSCPFELIDGTLGYRVTVMARSINPAHRVRCLLPPRDQPILQPYISIRRYSQHSTILGHNITYISPSMDEVTPSIVSSLGAHTFTILGNGLDFAGDLYRFETRLAAYNDVATGWTCGVIESFYTNITLTCPIIFPEIPHIIILMSSASSLTISTPPIVAPALTGVFHRSLSPFSLSMTITTSAKIPNPEPTLSNALIGYAFMSNDTSVNDIHMYPDWNCTLNSPTCTIGIASLLHKFATYVDNSPITTAFIISHGDSSFVLPIRGAPLPLEQFLVTSVDVDPWTLDLTVKGSGDMYVPYPGRSLFEMGVVDRRSGQPGLFYHYSCHRTEGEGPDFFTIVCETAVVHKIGLYSGPWDFTVRFLISSQDSFMYRFAYPDPTFIPPLLKEDDGTLKLPGTGIHSNLSISIGSKPVAMSALEHIYLAFYPPVFPDIQGGGFALNIKNGYGTVIASVPYALGDQYIVQNLPNLSSTNTSLLNTGETTHVQFHGMYLASIDDYPDVKRYIVLINPRVPGTCTLEQIQVTPRDCGLVSIEVTRANLDLFVEGVASSISTATVQIPAGRGTDPLLPVFVVETLSEGLHQPGLNQTSSMDIPIRLSYPLHTMDRISGCLDIGDRTFQCPTNGTAIITIHGKHFGPSLSAPESLNLPPINVTFRMTHLNEDGSEYNKVYTALLISNTDTEITAKLPQVDSSMYNVPVTITIGRSTITKSLLSFEGYFAIDGQTKLCSKPNPVPTVIEGRSASLTHIPHGYGGVRICAKGRFPAKPSVGPAGLAVQLGLVHWMNNPRSSQWNNLWITCELIHHNETDLECELAPGVAQGELQMRITDFGVDNVLPALDRLTFPPVSIVPYSLRAPRSPLSASENGVFTSRYSLGTLLSLNVINIPLAFLPQVSLQFTRFDNVTQTNLSIPCTNLELTHGWGDPSLPPTEPFPDPLIRQYTITCRMGRGGGSNYIPELSLTSYGIDKVVSSPSDSNLFNYPVKAPVLAAIKAGPESGGCKQGTGNQTTGSHSGEVGGESGTSQSNVDLGSRITSLSIYDCPTSGGVTITLVGHNFCAGEPTCLQSVRLGGAGDLMCQEVADIEETTLTCVLPPGSGRRYPVVTVLDDTSSESTAIYIQYASPRITRVHGCNNQDTAVGAVECHFPSSFETGGPTLLSKGGDNDGIGKVKSLNSGTQARLTIEGENFGPSGAQVFIGAYPCSDVVHDALSPHTLLTCVPPPMYSRVGLQLIVVTPESSTAHEAEESVSVSFAQCPKGYIPTANSSLCHPCSKGFYAATSASFLSSTSPTTLESTIECRPCPPGHFSSSPASDSCELCPQGTFNPNFAASTCQTCPSATFSSSPGAISCEPCRYGETNDTDSKWCIPCPVSQGFGRGNSGCQLCPNGTYSTPTSGGICQLCPAGRFSNISSLQHAATVGDGLNACIACPKGTYSANPGAPSCSPCSTGTYADIEGSLSCTPCVFGTAATSTGSSSCNQCSAGSVSFLSRFLIAYQENSNINNVALPTCSQCVQGKYAPINGSAECLPCQRGRYGTIRGAELCLPCDAGKYTPYEGNLTCFSCEPGRYSTLEMMQSGGATTCLNCPLGTVATNHGNSVCHICEAGKYSDGIAPDQPCASCPRNSYSSERGSSSCRPCPPGTVTPGNSEGHSGCVGCDPGTYWTSSYTCVTADLGRHVPEAGASQSFDCPAGTFANVTGLSYCYACAAGKASGLGATSCDICPAGRFAREQASECTTCSLGSYTPEPGMSSCEVCPAGKLRGLNAENNPDCLDCPAGSYSNQAGSELCSLCPPGTYSPTPSSSFCTECELGKTSNGFGATTCTSCAIGTYTMSSGSTAETCNPCEAGSWTNSTGLSSCTSCDPGSYRPATSTQGCAPCSPGSYSPRPGQASCTPCARGRYSPARGASICELCAPGKYSVGQGESFCPPCPSGSHSPFSASYECSACPAGTYQPDEEQSSCLPCPAGTFSSNPRSPSCSPCPLGTYASEPGQSTCIPCNPGYFANTTSLHECYSCEPGTAQPEEGKDHCIACAPGSSSPSRGTACSPCPSGRYAKEARSVLCDACPAGKFSRFPNATECESCPRGSIQPNSAEVRCISCPDGLAANSSGLAQCILCPSPLVPSFPRADRCVCSQGYYSTITRNYTLLSSPFMSAASSPSSSFFSRNSFSSIPQLSITLGDNFPEDCVRCPSGAICTSPDLSFSLLPTQSAYWRVSDLSHYFYRCPDPDACLGGDGAGYCAPNHDGVLCGLCTPGHYYVAGSCVECSSDELATVQVVMVILAFAIASLAFIWLVAFVDRPVVTDALHTLLREAVEEANAKAVLTHRFATDDLTEGAPSLNLVSTPPLGPSPSPLSIPTSLIKCNGQSSILRQGQDGSPCLRSSQNDFMMVVAPLDGGIVNGASAENGQGESGWWNRASIDGGIRIGRSESVAVSVVPGPLITAAREEASRREAAHKKHLSKKKPSSSIPEEKDNEADSSSAADIVKTKVGGGKDDAKGGDGKQEEFIDRRKELEQRQLQASSKEEGSVPGLVSKFKIVVGWSQLVAVFIMLPEIKWEAPVMQVGNALSVFLFTVSQWAGWHCFYEDTYYSHFWFTIGALLILTAIVFLAFTLPLRLCCSERIMIAKQKPSKTFVPRLTLSSLPSTEKGIEMTSLSQSPSNPCSSPSTTSPPTTASTTLNKQSALPPQYTSAQRTKAMNKILLAQTFKALQIVFFVAYPRTCLAFMRFFSCRNVEGVDLIEAHLASSCFDDMWYTYLPLILILTLLILLGIPTLYYFLLRSRSRANTLKHPYVALSLGFLFEGYRQEVWWFDLIDLTVKFLICGITPLLPVPGQLPFATAIICLFAGVIFVIAPYRRKGDDALHLYALMSLIVLGLTGQIIYSEVNYDSATINLNTVTLVIMLSCVVLYFLAQLLHIARKHCRR